MRNTNISKAKLLTVVVPIYNTAQFLGKCIESIIHQKYKRLDIILINDGSTDESGNICDSYMQIDSRVRVFHKKNQGLVATRKLGVELAKGELITFVDSDDWIENDMYFQMMDAYIESEPDIVVSGMVIDNVSEVICESNIILKELYEYEAINEKIIPTMMYNELMGDGAITPSVCNKIYKVDLLKKVIIDVEDSITYGEDAAITYIYIARATKIVILDNSWYHCTVRSNSMSRYYDINSFEQIYQFYNYMKVKFLELGIWSQMEEQVKGYTKKFFLWAAMRDVFDVLLEEPIYLFPFELIKQGSRVLIYGAGKVGISYVRSLLNSKYAKLQGWVDKNYKQLSAKMHMIESPDILKCRETDYIVIAVENEEIALEVRVFLKRLGIEDDKIVFKIPHRLN